MKTENEKTGKKNEKAEQLKMKERFQRSSQKDERGITLVALVITIVILIILALVTINFAFGDNGLIKQAEMAKDYQANADVTDSKLLNDATEYIDGIIGGNGSGGDIPDEPEEPFEPQPTPEPPTGGTEMSDMTNGVIEIKWLSGTSNNVSNSPNAPVIKSDLPSGTTMEQVVFDEGSSSWIAGTEYSYVAGTGSSDNTASHWANARVTKNGVESYFVWIPRYAYRIIYFDSAESKKAYQEGTLTEEEAVEQGKIIGYSDSRGIVDAEGRKIESVTSTTKTMVSEDYFMVHPAFTKEKENGGWTEELEGIWIGKYEVSSVEGNGDNVTSDNVTTKTVKVQPGISSWRYITIGNMYTVSRAYSEDLNSHMLKNSEWGAVAYLTESKYGRNGTEIGFSNQGYITGGGEENAYITNVNQSTTGNVYGIYDLRGGTYEYVAGYYKDGSLSYGSSFANGTSDEYSTAYDGTTTSTAYKYGDATYETSGWHSDNASFVNLDYSFFSRGGSFDYSEPNAGILLYGYSNGDSYYGHSFRLALVV